MVADSGTAASPAYETDTAGVKKHHVETQVKYSGLTPGQHVEPTIIGGPAPVVTPFKISPVSITDVTGDEDKYSLEKHGFQFVKHKSAFEKDLPDLKSRYSAAEKLDPVASGYYEEMVEFLKGILASNQSYPKPSYIHIMTHIIRKGPEDGEGNRSTMGPLYSVHVDQSAWSADGTARRWLGDRADELLQKPRYQIINLWRPCKPVTRDPFAVTDALSVPDADIVKIPLVFPDHKAESLEVVPAPADDPGRAPHRWFYKYNQQPDDLLVFIQVDTSKRDGVPKRCPHVAFKDPNLDESKGEPRVSIETRALVFYDED